MHPVVLCSPISTFKSSKSQKKKNKNKQEEEILGHEPKVTLFTDTKLKQGQQQKIHRDTYVHVQNIKI